VLLLQILSFRGLRVDYFSISKNVLLDSMGRNI